MPFNCMFCNKTITNLTKEDWDRFDYTTPGGITYKNIGIACGECLEKEAEALRWILQRRKIGNSK